MTSVLTKTLSVSSLGLSIIYSRNSVAVAKDADAWQPESFTFCDGFTIFKNNSE